MVHIASLVGDQRRSRRSRVQMDTNDQYLGSIEVKSDGIHTVPSVLPPGSPSLQSCPSGDQPQHMNERFQDLLDEITDETVLDRYHQFKALSGLARDFQYKALSYGKIIINEKYLPDEKKTIPPRQIGGIAGGDKYIVDDVLFKFSIDTSMYAFSRKNAFSHRGRIVRQR